MKPSGIGLNIFYSSQDMIKDHAERKDICLTLSSGIEKTKTLFLSVNPVGENNGSRSISCGPTIVVYSDGQLQRRGMVYGVKGFLPYRLSNTDTDLDISESPLIYGELL